VTFSASNTALFALLSDEGMNQATIAENTGLNQYQVSRYWRSRGAHNRSASLPSRPGSHAGRSRYTNSSPRWWRGSPRPNCPKMTRRPLPGAV